LNTIFSTADVHPRDRFDYWHNVACKTIVPHDSEPLERLSFSAKLSEARIGDIDVISFENSPMQVTHSQKHIRLTSPDDLLVCLHNAESSIIEQDGREARTGMGDVVLIDPARPYRAHFQSNSKLLVFKVPRIFMAGRAAAISSITALPIRPTAGVPGFISNILGVLPQHVGRLDPSAHTIIQSHVLDLIGIAFGQLSPGRPVPQSQWLGVARLKSEVNVRLGDPGLNPARVAAAANMSIRHANGLLAQEGTSLARLIRDLRIARVVAALSDASMANLSIKEIASQWGLSDMTHFGRIFKKRFGSTPRDYRKGAKNE
jgi:AraC family transcriptional regulator, positive regulator of tynA and feaB